MKNGPNIQIGQAIGPAREAFPFGRMKILRLAAAWPSYRASACVVIPDKVEYGKGPCKTPSMFLGNRFGIVGNYLFSAPDEE